MMAASEKIRRERAVERKGLENAARALLEELVASHESGKLIVSGAEGDT